MIRVAWILLPTITILTIPTATISAQTTWRDVKFGYAIQTLRNWNAVPTQATQQYLVAKWTAPRHIRELPAEVHIYVFNKGPRVQSSDSRAPAAAIGQPHAHRQEHSYEDWIKRDGTRRTMRLSKSRTLRVKTPKGLLVESAGIRTSRRPSRHMKGTRVMSDFFVMTGIVKTPTLEYAIECFCSVQAERKMRPLFTQVIRSFKLTGKPGTAGETAATEGKDGYARTALSPKEAARKRAREQVARTPGWWFLETPRYIFVTDVPEKKKPFVKDLGRRLEAMRDQYEKDFPPTKAIHAVSIVRVCKDRKSYADYGGPGGSAGYWYAPGEELVFFKEGDTDKPLKVLNHEAFHQYIYYACGRLSPHSWYNEGYGDYYAGARLSGRRVTSIKPFSWRRDTIRDAIRRGTHIPIKDIIRYSKKQYYANPKVCYAEGWSIVYFLNKGLPRNHPWQKILPTYFRVLQETKDKKEAVSVAFRDVDLDAFEQAWAAFTVRGKRVTSR